MLFLLGVLLFVLFCLTVLIRALLLFPLRGRRQGWSPALRRYALSLLLCGGVLLWELGALYGFSWQHMGRADRQQMADAAVAFAYPEAYANLAQLHSDYARFRPEVSYWASWEYESSNGVLDKLAGDTHYQIRLPDLVVVADVHGRPMYQFPLDDEQDIVAPDRPELGLIGDIQDERRLGIEDDQIQLRWSRPQHGEAEVHVSCFSAYSSRASKQTLELNAVGADPVQIVQPPGFYRVQIVLVAQGEYHYSYSPPQRISRAAFIRLRNDCRSLDAASRS
ncbi:hypothetical protein IB234_05090 [Pseudomonas sp. PDM16]|uniref:hypothetical protein n=1 Tax=Pseudomonas sp. PDM16 TaxID=2769292 RepID=UPI001782775F|nr:hypothetical protein [Pseudomonas sp. PDM16]MBD9413934.1 hypothetical protein [Pseudomonas sp. PDM16]